MEKRVISMKQTKFCAEVRSIGDGDDEDLERETYLPALNNEFESEYRIFLCSLTSLFFTHKSNFGDLVDFGKWK